MEHSPSARTVLLRGDPVLLLSSPYSTPSLPQLMAISCLSAAVVEEHKLGRCVYTPQGAGVAGGPSQAGDTEGHSKPHGQASRAVPSRCTPNLSARVLAQDDWTE